MFLRTNFGPEILDPTRADIEQVIHDVLKFPEEDFALLAVSDGDEMFIQTVPTANDGSRFRLEYGPGDGSIYSIDDLSMQAVIDFFQAFNDGDAAWRSDPRWKNEANQTNGNSEFFAALEELVQETGRSLEDWVRLVASSGLVSNPTDRSACRQWLINTYGLRPEQAKRLVAYVQLAVGLSERLDEQPPSKTFTEDEECALQAFEKAHREFVREHFEQAARQFQQLIDTYPHVLEVAKRARGYLKAALTRLSGIDSTCLPQRNAQPEIDPFSHVDFESLGLSDRAAKLALEKARFWEYDLFIQVMRDEVDRARSAFSHTETNAHVNGRIEGIGSAAIASKWFNERFVENHRLIQSLSNVLNNQESAFGPPGVPGDVAAIVSLSREVGAYCQTWAEWAQMASRAMVDPTCAEAVKEFKAYARSVVEAVACFADDYMTHVERFRRTPPGTKQDHDVSLKLPNISNLDEAVKKLNNHVNLASPESIEFASNESASRGPVGDAFASDVSDKETGLRAFEKAQNEFVSGRLVAARTYFLRVLQNHQVDSEIVARARTWLELIDERERAAVRLEVRSKSPVPDADNTGITVVRKLNARQGNSRLPELASGSRQRSAESAATCLRCRKGTTFFHKRIVNQRTGRCQQCDLEVTRALESFKKGLEQFLKAGLKADDMRVLRQSADDSQIDFGEVLAYCRSYSIGFLERFVEFFRKAGTMDDAMMAHVEFLTHSILPARDSGISSIRELAITARQHSAYVQDLRNGLTKPPQCDTSIYLQEAEKSFLDVRCTYRAADRPYGSGRAAQLVLTNRRWVLLSFDGGMEFSWNKILSAEDTSEGIRLVLTTKKGSGTYEVAEIGLFQAIVASLLRMVRAEPVRSRRKSATRPRRSNQRATSGSPPPPPPPRPSPRSRPKDPYEVLGVTNRSTPQEITAAFRKLAQMYHPDKVESLAPEYREIARRKMLEINVAYDSLMRRR